MNKRLNPVGILSTLVLVLLSGEAAANGLVIDASRLTPQVRTSLERQVQLERQKHPTRFSALADLQRELIARDAKKRGRMSGITPAIRALGSDALFPILEQLMLRRPAGPAMTATAHVAWSANLLEALGSLRSPKAEAALREATGKSSTMDPLVLRSAAAALGKIGSTSAAKHLLRLSRGSSLRSKAALAGMGYCRRLLCAQELATRLAQSKTLGSRHLLARALGDVGNSWAWQTPLLKRRGEGSAVRHTAMAALLNGYVRFNDQGLRKHLRQALLVVNHPDTLQQIQRQHQRHSDVRVRQALDQLRQRFLQSPLRSKSKQNP